MNETTTPQIEVPTPAAGAEGPSMMFFGIGLVINLLLITAYFVWAYRQGKKRDRPDE
ncbi:MAG: hypothetical protein QNJ85_02975 [Gammaproteobacteria bacterium]|nr:hypothetical protein [Gammaproteobacteria bacterium]